MNFEDVDIEENESRGPLGLCNGFLVPHINDHGSREDDGLA